MTTKQLIRVEHLDGIGMFISFHNGKDREFNVENILPKLYDRHQRFPCPFEDGFKRQDNEFCAFKSIEQIQKWIEPEEFDVLFNNGYKVLLLDVSECKEGSHQCLYKKENILQSKDISDLFKLKTSTKQV